MRHLLGFLRLLKQIAKMSVTNRSFMLGLAIAMLLLIGLLLLSVQVSAPFIYTLF